MAFQVATVPAFTGVEDYVDITYPDVGSDSWGYDIGNVANVTLWIEMSSPAPTRTTARLNTSAHFSGTPTVTVFPR